MNDLSDPKIRARWDDVLEDLNMAIGGALDCELAHAPQMTPIEILAHIQLLGLALSERAYEFGVLKIEPQKQVGKHRVDFLLSFMDKQFVVECDGHDFHEKTKHQASRDKQRDRDLQRLDLKVFRFTGSEIWKDSSWIKDVDSEIEEIRIKAYRAKHGP